MGSPQPTCAFLLLDEVLDGLHTKKNLDPQVLAAVLTKFSFTPMKTAERRQRAKRAAAILHKGGVATGGAGLVPSTGRKGSFSDVEYLSKISRTELEGLLTKSGKELRAKAKAEGLPAYGRKAFVAEQLIRLSARHRHRQKEYNALPSNTSLSSLRCGMTARSVHTDVFLARKRCRNLRKPAKDLENEAKAGAEKKRKTFRKGRHCRQEEVKKACDGK